MHENINGVLLKPLSGGGNESIDPTLKVRMQRLSQLLKRVDHGPLVLRAETAVACGLSVLGQWTHFRRQTEA